MRSDTYYLNNRPRFFHLRFQSHMLCLTEGPGSMARSVDYLHLSSCLYSHQSCL